MSPIGGLYRVSTGSSAVGNGWEKGTEQKEGELPTKGKQL